MSPQPTPCVFDSERWAVVHGTTKLTSNIKASVLDAYHGVATETCLFQKYKWALEIFTSINWPAIAMTFGKLSPLQRVKHSKLMHSWLPVQTPTARYAKSTDNLCPLCQLVPELKITYIAARTQRQFSTESPHGTNVWKPSTPEENMPVYPGRL